MKMHTTYYRVLISYIADTRGRYRCTITDNQKRHKAVI